MTLSTGRFALADIHALDEAVCNDEDMEQGLIGMDVAVPILDELANLDFRSARIRTKFARCQLFGNFARASQRTCLIVR